MSAPAASHVLDRAYHAAHPAHENFVRSFDTYVDTMLEEIVRQPDVFQPQTGSGDCARQRHTVWYENVRCLLPTYTESDASVRLLTPTEAQVRGFPYQCTFVFDVCVACDAIHPHPETSAVRAIRDGYTDMQRAGKAAGGFLACPQKTPDDDMDEARVREVMQTSIREGVARAVARIADTRPDNDQGWLFWLRDRTLHSLRTYLDVRHAHASVADPGKPTIPLALYYGKPKHTHVPTRRIRYAQVTMQQFPVMVGSKVCVTRHPAVLDAYVGQANPMRNTCHLAPGGYFILQNGKHAALKPFTKLRFNAPLVTAVPGANVPAYDPHRSVPSNVAFVEGAAADAEQMLCRRRRDGGDGSSPAHPQHHHHVPWTDAQASTRMVDRTSPDATRSDSANTTWSSYDRIYFLGPAKRRVVSTIKCEVRSIAWFGKYRSTSTLVLHLTPHADIYMSIPFRERNLLRAPIVFRLLGCDTPDAMLRLVWPTGRVPPEESQLFATFAHVVQRDPIYQLPASDVFLLVGQTLFSTKGTTPVEWYCELHRHMTNEILPQMGTDDCTTTRHKKLCYLGQLCRYMLCANQGLRPTHSRDFEGFKMCEMAHMKLATLQRQQMLKGFHKYFKQYYNRKIANITPLDIQLRVPQYGAKHLSPTRRFRHGYLMFQPRAESNDKHIQYLNTTTPQAINGYLLRLEKPMDRQGKAKAPRRLDGSSLFLMCSTETPEGEKCGLVRSFALYTYVRTGTPTSQLLYWVRRVVPPVDDDDDDDNHDDANDPLIVYPFRSLDAYLRAQEESTEHTPIFVNGDLFGYTPVPARYIARLRKARRYGRLPWCTSVFLSWQGITVSGEAGVIMTPLMRVDRLDLYAKLVQTYSADTGASPAYLWHLLVMCGVVEYVDANEALAYKVGTSVEDARARACTHVTISSVQQYGTLTAMIPGANHNQTPRNTYQAAMAKQAVGVTATDASTWTPVTAYRLWYPQRPLVSTRTGQTHGYDTLSPAGTNVLILVMAWNGMNMEDAVIWNRRSLELGTLVQTVYRTYREFCRGTDDRFEHPLFPYDDGAALGPTVSLQECSYDKLDADGTVAPGTRIQHGDAIIGYTRRRQEDGVDRRIDASTVFKCRSYEQATVDSTKRLVDGNGHNVVKVTVRIVRPCEPGDKFASRCQKGVCGQIVDPQDMPTITSGPYRGRQPDVITTPNGEFRMTLGQKIEGAMSKLAAHYGVHIDGTPFETWHLMDPVRRLRDTNKFSPCTLDALERELAALGLGRVTAMDGVTGTVREGLTMDMQYFQRLTHMTSDKIHARARGPLDPITNQPVERRWDEGGIRFGYMDRYAAVSSGAMEQLRNVLTHCSDGTLLPVCTTCGHVCETAAWQPQFLVSPPPSNDVDDNKKNHQRGIYVCRQCESNGRLFQVRHVIGHTSWDLMRNEIAALDMKLRHTLPAPDVSTTGKRRRDAEDDDADVDADAVVAPPSGPTQKKTSKKIKN